MGRLVGKARYRDILLGAGLLWATLALVLWPEQAIGAMRDGIALCGNVILPSLFPFFVLSSLVVELGMSRYLGKLLEPVMAPLFRVNGSCAAALAEERRTSSASGFSSMCSRSCPGSPCSITPVLPSRHGISRHWTLSPFQNFTMG